jgi:4-hydroxy-tetrahydrodipicolinate reductase
MSKKLNLSSDDQMKKRRVLIVGNGKLATELISNLSGDTISSVARWDSRHSSQDKRVIVIHAGSGREMAEVIDYCLRTGSTLFQLSTSGSEIPNDVAFPVIICPNVNLLVLQFLAMLRCSASSFRDYSIEITESHHASKKTVAGTAKYIAGVFDVEQNRIKSVRDPEVQKTSFGIPAEFIDRHAVHRIVISNKDSEITLETKVLGKVAYASGLGKIIDKLSRKNLLPGMHDIVELFTEE